MRVAYRVADAIGNICRNSSNSSNALSYVRGVIPVLLTRAASSACACHVSTNTRNCSMLLTAATSSKPTGIRATLVLATSVYFRLLAGVPFFRPPPARYPPLPIATPHI
ncbi:hypothetical protein I8752_20060 [Nostocaceae cyanobacterium CENA369]|uniref:Uncharacterized protein n=1 Tax=Dendronalium phyllosphericum CENA369 TaxID=1725256 RepID=A0A8J7I3U3_9NOST|nr:hypothetical protein [Dendronalium phyllosphericum]MBH8575266.1 hypothetical protein [Dendronalium phyllosphericum CENA369]